MKKIIIIFMATLLSTGFVANAQYHYDFSAINADGDTLCYNITSATEPYTVEVASCSDTATLTTPLGYTYLPEYYNYDSLVTIPSTVIHDGITYTVTSLARRAFVGQRNLRTVILPATVICISNEAFRKSTLQNISMPAVSYIGDEAFNRTNIAHIDLPDNLSYLGAYAFYWTPLQEIEIPANLDTLREGTFAICLSLNNIIFHEGLKVLGSGFIQGNNLMDTLIFPRSLKQIGSLGLDTTCKYVEFQNDMAHPNETVFLNGTFAQMEGLQTVVLPQNAVLSEYCFFQCTSLTSVNLPSNLTVIPLSCFEGCWSLDSLALPVALDSIGEQAFRQCGTLHSLTIPSQVLYIGKNAFGGPYSQQTGLFNVTMLGETPPTLDNSAFYSATYAHNILFNIPCHTTEAYSTAPGWSDYNNFTYHEDCVGIDTYPNTDALKVYPNPAIDVIHMEAGVQNIEQATLYDAFGRLVFSQSIQNNVGTIRLTDFESGMYILRITLDNGIEKSMKIVVRNDK